MALLFGFILRCQATVRRRVWIFELAQEIVNACSPFTRCFPVQSKTLVRRVYSAAWLRRIFSASKFSYRRYNAFSLALALPVIVNMRSPVSS